MYVCVRERETVCVCEREIERERESSVESKFVKSFDAYHFIFFNDGRTIN